jgi:hypothetical protein
MKKIFIAIAFALLSLTLTAKEVSKNFSTGMILSEELGIYTITGKGGAIILGDVKVTRNTLASLEKCFIQAHLNNYIDCGEQKWEVRSDEDGLYIIKVGLGAVKIRQSDVNIFLIKVESIIAKDKLSRIGKIIKE